MMLKRMKFTISRLFRGFSITLCGDFLDLPKIKFERDRFSAFLKERYWSIKTPTIVFGSSPLRWVFGLFQWRKNRIILFWPAILDKSMSRQKYSMIPAFASTLAHETSHFLESKDLLGRALLTFQDVFYYGFILLTGIYLLSKNFPLYILIWPLSFLVYFILPSEIKARRFAKKEMENNQKVWTDFFEIK